MRKTHIDDVAQWQRDCLHWRGRVLMGRFAHYCGDWDGLPVDETTPDELECCSCNVIVASVTAQPARPINWQCVVRPATKDCYWLEMDGTRHEATPDENRRIAADLAVLDALAESRRMERGRNG